MISPPEHALAWLPRSLHIFSPQWLAHCCASLTKSEGSGDEEKGSSNSSDKRTSHAKLVCLSPDIARHLARSLAATADVKNDSNSDSGVGKEGMVPAEQAITLGEGAHSSSGESALDSVTGRQRLVMQIKQQEQQAHSNKQGGSSRAEGVAGMRELRVCLCVSGCFELLRTPSIH